MVMLKSGEVLKGEVANMMFGFIDQWLARLRLKEFGVRRARKYHPWQIQGYTRGSRQFVSLRFQRNNALFQEKYTLNMGNEYIILEVYKERHLIIYLEYYTDDDA